MKVFVLFALAALCVATPLEQVKADLARLEADIRAKTNPAFLAQTPNDDDASLSASEEERIRRVVEAEPDLVQFGDDPKFEEHDESAGENFDDDASLTPSADPNCSAARGVCMDNAATNCRAPRQVRRGLCNGAAHRMCCVGSNEGGSPAAPETRPVATNTNWLTEVGGVRVTRMDRSGRSTFPTHVPNKFVVHTTEGWWPRPGVEGSHAALDGARVWAHFLIGVGRDGSMKVYQYLPLNVRATALKRNNLGSIQVEVSALTCCPFTSYDKALTDLTRALFTAVRAACPNIKNEVIAPNDWARPVRFSLDNWNRASGITGHMFAPVPDNHNDPGHINPSALLSDFSASTLTFKSTNELRQCLTQCRPLPHIVRYYSDPNREVSFTKF